MRANYKGILFTILIFIAPYVVAAEKFSERKDVQRFIEQVSEKHALDKEELLHIFNNVESSQSVIDKISQPAESLNWNQYRKIFISKSRINQGVKYWKLHKDLLDKAQKKYNVPAHIIVSIIGVETHYGIKKGNHQVIQALATLAFDYPKRSKFFTDELENFLLLTKENNLDPLNMKGSYAGAIGIAQFMPSSYRHYAKSFNGTGAVDLITRDDDAIESVANYLKVFGWRGKKTLVLKAKALNKDYQTIIAKNSNPRPKYNLSTLSDKYSVLPESNTVKPSNNKFALVEFSNDSKTTDLWLISDNFYAITRYNHSSNYAMAVYQLSELIAQEFNKTQA